MFRAIGKIGFVLVLIGFLMPVSCDMNGFKLAAEVKGEDAMLMLCLYGIFVSALFGAIVGLLLLLKKNVPVVVDWIAVVATSVFELIPLLANLKKSDVFQAGVYLMLAGAGVALLFQIVSSANKEQS